MLSLTDNTFKGHQNIFQDNSKEVTHRNLAMKNVDGKVWKTNLLEVLASLVGFTSMQDGMMLLNLELPSHAAVNLRDLSDLLATSWSVPQPLS